MSDSRSSQEPLPNPPPAQDDPVAWGRWAVEFLDRFCQMWSVWRRSWTVREVPYYRTGNPDAYLSLERVTRQVGITRELVRGSPPPGFSQAARLLDVCSGAVQRFSAQSAWVFESAKQADEVAQGLLEVAQGIVNAHYQGITQTRLERLSRLVKMATRRPKSVADHWQGKTPPSPRSKAANGKRVGEPATDPEPVELLKPAHARAKALYDWAMEHIDGAEKMTYAELFEKLTIDQQCAGEGLPNNAAAFARYCRAAGVQRNTPRCEKGATRSVRRVSDL